MYLRNPFSQARVAQSAAAESVKKIEGRKKYLNCFTSFRLLLCMFTLYIHKFSLVLSFEIVVDASRPNARIALVFFKRKEKINTILT